jgi:hypothetical protein
MSEALLGVVGGRAATKAVTAHFQQARFCMHQFFVKRDFWLGAEQFALRLVEYARDTEVSDVVPQRVDQPELRSAAAAELGVLLSEAENTHALHFMCRQVHKKLLNEERDPKRMEEELSALATFVAPEKGELFDAAVWHSLFLGGDNKALATRALRLIETFFAKFAARFGRPVLDQRPYYQELIRVRYLLPRDHFERGF